jgi:hypothetical protein
MTGTPSSSAVTPCALPGPSTTRRRRQTHRNQSDNDQPPRPRRQHGYHPRSSHPHLSWPIRCTGSRTPTAPEARRWPGREGKVAGQAYAGSAGVPREAPRAGDAASNQIRQQHRDSDREHEPERHAEEAVECAPGDGLCVRGGLPREPPHRESCDGDGSRDTDEDVCHDDELVSSGTPQASLTSLLDHGSSIGSNNVILALSR